jgi:methyl-galactoside transport system permease protein
MCAGSLFGIQWLPNLAIIALIVAVIIWFLYNHTPYGKKMYAIGGNPAAAEVSGINTVRMTIVSYMIASALFALAGFMLGGKAGGTSASLAAGWELFAIAGCTIGGVSVNGGIGTVPGILLGVLVFEILKIEMQFMGVDVAYTYIVQGIVIVVAIALDIRKYLVKK